MKFQVKNRRHKKGEPRRNIRDFCDKAEIQAENDQDAVALSNLFRVFMDVGAAGLYLILKDAVKEIKELKDKQS